MTPVEKSFGKAQKAILKKLGTAFYILSELKQHAGETFHLRFTREGRSYVKAQKEYYERKNLEINTLVRNVLLPSLSNETRTLAEKFLTELNDGPRTLLNAINSTSRLFQRIMVRKSKDQADACLVIASDGVITFSSRISWDAAMPIKEIRQSGGFSPDSPYPAQLWAWTISAMKDVPLLLPDFEARPTYGKTILVTAAPAAQSGFYENLCSRWNNGGGGASRRTSGYKNPAP